MIAVLLSGGMDSAAALFLAIERHGRENVTAVFVDYGQKAVGQEQRASWDLAAEVNCVPWFQERVYVHGGSIAGFGGELTGPDTVVPGRNERLINAARLNGETVWYSPHSGDWAVYEDCRPEFVASQENVVAPFLYLTKQDIVSIGNRLGVPWELTWSCYAPVGGGLPCGQCGACIERGKALK